MQPDLPEVWAKATGAGVRVAVIDSGFDRSIADKRVLTGTGLVADVGTALVRSSDDQDRHGHGTSCADLVLQVAPDAVILPIRVFGRELDTAPEVLVAAIEHATTAGARIINLSLGTDREDAKAALYRACERARRAGVTIVAASAGGTRDYPAAFEPVLGVRSAMVAGRFDFVYWPDETIECGASGRGQRARGLGGATVTRHGSSFAAPVVSGLIARLLQSEGTLDLEGVRAGLCALHARRVRREI